MNSMIQPDLLDRPHLSVMCGTPDVVAAQILAKLQTATAAIQELQEMLEEGE